MSINNKKKHIDKKISDNESNKKQKIDSNDNNNENDNNSIEISNLNQHTVIKLKELAASLGLEFKSNIKKQDLIDKITLQESNKQKEINDNLNSFNKGIIEFKIKDGVDELEWLFWKIFRNKFIFKKIMSFMDLHITQTYESIIIVYEMIKSNQLYMLRDKVIRNQYLKFDSGKFRDDINNIFNIFNYFKKDELFYKSFFKNYNKYIPGFNEISNEETQEDHINIINELIKSNNILALNILIQDYNFKPTNDNLYYSIENGKLKFIKLFLQPKFKLKIDIEDIIDHLQEKQVNPKIYKSLNYHDQKLVQLNKIKDLKTNLSINEKTTLKELISIIKLILNEQKQQHQQLIDLNQFTKDELKLEFTNSALSNHKESLKSLIEFYYKFGKSVKRNDEIPVTDLFYHLYLCDNESVIDKLNKNNENVIKKLNIWSITEREEKFKYYLKLSLQYSSFKTLDHIITGHNYLRNEDFLSEFILSNHLFSFCKKQQPQDKEKQIKFINSIIKESNESIKVIFRNDDFLRLLIVYDDLELVKHYLNGISKFKKSNEIISKIKHFSLYIKSNEMLEYLYEKYQTLISNSVFDFKNTQLLYKFEELHRNKNNNTSQISFKEYIYPDSKFKSNEILIHILSNPSIYKIKSANFYSIIQHFIYKFSNEVIYQMCKLVYLNYQLFDNYILNSGDYDNLIRSFGFIKFIDWLFINNHDVGKYFQDLQLVLFKLDRYNSIYKDPKEIDIMYLDYISEIENIKILDYYLKRLATIPEKEFSKMNGQNHVFNVLLNCIESGQLKSFEHIYKNHSWVFRTSKGKPSKPIINGYSTTLTSIKNLLMSSLESDYLELSEILFQLVSVTQNEFNENAGTLSKSYFKNKKFNKK